MGFWVGFMSVGPLQGDSWVFWVFLGVSLGFKGQFIAYKCHFIDEHVKL